MSHLINIDIAIANVATSTLTLTSPVSTHASPIEWQSVVAYRNNYQLICLPSTALASSALTNTQHLLSSTANASNIPHVTATSANVVTPYRLLLDLRWVVGVREVNVANAATPKGGCELLVKYNDGYNTHAAVGGSASASASATAATFTHARTASSSTPFAFSHPHPPPPLSASTMPPPSAAPERYLHMRFSTDGERQKIAFLLRTAIERNSLVAAMERLNVKVRLDTLRKLGALKADAVVAAEKNSSIAALAAATMRGERLHELLTDAHTQFLFAPRLNRAEASLAAGGSAVTHSPDALTGRSALSPPLTLPQNALACMPLVFLFPCSIVTVGGSGSGGSKTEQKRLLEVIVYPHQAAPVLATGTSHTGVAATSAVKPVGSAPAINNRGSIVPSTFLSHSQPHASTAQQQAHIASQARTNLLRLWRPASSSTSSSSSSSTAGAHRSHSDGTVPPVHARFLHSLGLSFTASSVAYTDITARGELALSISANELCDLRFDCDRAEIDIAAYIDGTDDDATATAAASTTSPHMSHSSSSSSTAAGATTAAHPAAAAPAHRRLVVRRLCFPAPCSFSLFRRAVEALRWFQQSQPSLYAAPADTDHSAAECAPSSSSSTASNMLSAGIEVTRWFVRTGKTFEEVTSERILLWHSYDTGLTADKKGVLMWNTLAPPWRTGHLPLEEIKRIRRGQ